MTKKILFVTAVLLALSSPLAAQGHWYWNKDVENWSTEPAYDIAVILSSNPDIKSTCNGCFSEFDSYPIGPYTCLHWTNPWGGIPVGMSEGTHIGIWGPDNDDENSIVDMYWTDQQGRRLEHSVVWNATTEVRYEDGNAVVRIANDVTPVDEYGNLIDEEWAALRDVTIRELRYAVVDMPYALEELNNANEELNSSMELLSPEEMVIPGEILEIVLPRPIAEGQYVVVRWDNLAEGFDGTSMTVARDWIQQEMVSIVSPASLEEEGSIPAVKPLEVHSYPGYVEIAYTLGQSSHVILNVYSVSGERVASLVDETRNAGSYTIRWDAKDVPAGTYIAKLSVDGLSAAEKMVHLK